MFLVGEVLIGELGFRSCIDINIVEYMHTTANLHFKTKSYTDSYT